MDGAICLRTAVQSQKIFYISHLSIAATSQVQLCLYIALSVQSFVLKLGIFPEWISAVQCVQ